MHTLNITHLLVASWLTISIVFAMAWYRYERRRTTTLQALPTLTDTLTGFGANFFDTLGISSFATTTATYKLAARMPDEHLPGTLNVGHALPTLAQAIIFTVAVTVDITTLLTMMAAAVAGAWIGAGIVSKLSRKFVRVGMATAMLLAALLLAASNLSWMPAGGTTVGLTGTSLLIAISINFIFGALMTLGIGLYAPCLILVSLLGMNPLAAFPIMMGSCAFLMPMAGLRFVREKRYNLPAALGLALGGIPGVLIAVYIVKSLPIVWMRWLVVVVVIYTAFLMLTSASRKSMTPNIASPPQ